MEPEYHIVRIKEGGSATADEIHSHLFLLLHKKDMLTL